MRLLRRVLFVALAALAVILAVDLTAEADDGPVAPPLPCATDSTCTVPAVTVGHHARPRTGCARCTLDESCPDACAVNGCTASCAGLVSRGAHPQWYDVTNYPGWRAYAVVNAHGWIERPLQWEWTGGTISPAQPVTVVVRPRGRPRGLFRGGGGGCCGR